MPSKVYLTLRSAREDASRRAHPGDAIARRRIGFRGRPLIKLATPDAPVDSAMYLFNKIVDFLAFLCRLGNVTPESIKAHAAAEQPRRDEARESAGYSRVHRLFRG